jgi:hypothetical protein
MRDLLVEQTADYKRKDLALAQRQPFVGSAPLSLPSPRLPLGGAPNQCPLHYFEHLAPPHRLGKEINQRMASD